jgi:diaminopimelate decarboxylase
VNSKDSNYYRYYFDLAKKKGLLGREDSAVIFYDFSVLERQIKRVRSAFPRNAIHAVAIKTNPLICVLRKASEFRMAAEAASFEEMALAAHAGFGRDLVWDSPAKTEMEISEACKIAPMLINVDSLEELKRYRGRLDFSLGLRVNPEISPDTIPSLAVGRLGSKFGVPLSRKDEIIKAFIEYKNLVGLHVHSSSNSKSLEPLAEGITKVLNLATEIDDVLIKAEKQQRIRYLDIGGGLPMYDPEDSAVSVERYAALLNEQCPVLFSDKYRLVTEFGRYYHAHAGWTVTRVEYVKSDANVTNVITHVGADHFVRETYDRVNWRLALEKLPASSVKKQDQPEGEQAYRVAGPLCFEGDVISQSISLDWVRPGEFLVIGNTGANTYSLWSRHCSRPFPKVITFSSKAKGKDIAVGKRRETTKDLIAFWS